MARLDRLSHAQEKIFQPWPGLGLAGTVLCHEMCSLVLQRLKISNFLPCNGKTVREHETRSQQKIKVVQQSVTELCSKNYFAC